MAGTYVTRVYLVFCYNYNKFLLYLKMLCIFSDVTLLVMTNPERPFNAKYVDGVVIYIIWVLCIAVKM